MKGISGVSGGGGPHDKKQIRSHFASSVIAANMASSSSASGYAVWNGALAFSNIGFSGEAVSGRRWRQHSERVRRLVVELLRGKPLLGVLLNEVGNLTHLLDADGKEQFTQTILEAFNVAQYDAPTVVWRSGETMAAFKSGVSVTPLSCLTKMKGVHPWRTVERFEVSGAIDHEPVKMLVYNTHQPSSDLRPFLAPMRIKFCTAVLHDAIRHQNSNPTSCGWVFGGDANCSMAVWIVALEQVPLFRLAFDQPSFISGINNKRGDLIVAAAVKGESLSIFENKCALAGREMQHDPMYFEWCYRARAARAVVPLPAREGLQEASNKKRSCPQNQSAEGEREAHRSFQRAAEEFIDASSLLDREDAEEESWSRLEADFDEVCSLLEASERDAASDVSEVDDDDDAGPRRMRVPEEQTSEHLDELSAIGFALAKSYVSRAELLNSRAKDCIGAALVKPITNACSPEEREELASRMNMFFTKRPVLQSTPPNQNNENALVLKTGEEIQEAWEHILKVRRQYQPDDQQPISDHSMLCRMWNNWSSEWLARELTPQQKEKTPLQKTSIFRSWVFKNAGGKYFVMAIWQAGITWAPTPDLLDSDFNSAVEHVAKNFSSWTGRLARAVHRHKHDEATEEARRRSGNRYRKHGMTEEEEQHRKDRAEARRNHRITAELAKQLRASKGKGQGKGKSKGKRGASEHTLQPRTWDDISRSERWWLEQYWKGNLWRARKRAEAKCHKVEAAPFSIGDAD